jgi:hypothetical protein
MQWRVRALCEPWEKSLHRNAVESARALCERSIHHESQQADPYDGHGEGAKVAARPAWRAAVRDGERERELQRLGEQRIRTCGTCHREERMEERCQREGHSWFSAHVPAAVSSAVRVRVPFSDLLQ